MQIARLVLCGIDDDLPSAGEILIQPAAVRVLELYHEEPRRCPFTAFVEFDFSDDGLEWVLVDVLCELVVVEATAAITYFPPAVSALKPITSTIPIVFTQVSDPVGSGFVTDLAHPGGNITGFHSFEPAIGGKWLEVLKQIAPSVRRAAVVHDPRIAANVSFFRAAESASSSLGRYCDTGRCN